MVDWFLCGKFAGFSMAITSFGNSTDFETVSHIFPKIAKCTYEDFGPSGSIQVIDAICVLPLNVVNEKMYVLLWFWFTFLSLLSFFGILYRVMTYTCKPIRSLLLMAPVRCLSKKNADIIVNRLSWGDWFVLNQLNKNLDPAIFEELIFNLEYKISGCLKIRVRP